MGNSFGEDGSDDFLWDASSRDDDDDADGGKNALTRAAMMMMMNDDTMVTLFSVALCISLVSSYSSREDSEDNNQATSNDLQNEK
jgi:hypothetical protein